MDERTLWGAMRSADRGILASLNRHYGSPEAANDAIREAMKTPEVIEEWATVVQKDKYRRDRRQAELEGAGFYFVPNVDLRDDEEWTFEHLPPPLREWALQSMAAAMLAWTAGEERKAKRDRIA